MKRLLLVAIVSISILLAARMSAAGGTVPPASHAHGASLLTWQQRWMAWAFGSSTNPLLSGICGEQVGRMFFLNASVAPGTQEVECQIPHGVPLLGTPGGGVAWAPTDGQTREELLAARDGFLADTVNHRVTLDGRPLSLDDTLRLTDVYSISLEEGNFIQTVDPGVLGDETQVASGALFVRIHPLTPGSHVLVFSDEAFGDVFEIIFRITVG